MQKWEYLRVHAEITKGKLVASVDGKPVMDIDIKDSSSEEDLTKHLNSLGAEGWEMVSAQKMNTDFRITFSNALSNDGFVKGIIPIAN